MPEGIFGDKAIFCKSLNWSKVSFLGLLRTYFLGTGSVECFESNKMVGFYEIPGNFLGLTGMISRSISGFLI